MGRPKSFDPDAALDRAVDVFWRKGYDGASVDDLTRAMGINRFSMYNTFGDKHALFLRALERHEDELACLVIPRLEAIEDFEGLRAYLYDKVDAVLEQSPTRCGCVMVLTAVSRAGHDPASRSVVERHMERFTAALRAVFERIEASVGLADGITPTDAARFVTVMIQGLIVAGAGGQTRAGLRRTVRHTLEWLGMAR